MDSFTIRGDSKTPVTSMTDHLDKINKKTNNGLKHHITSDQLNRYL